MGLMRFMGVDGFYGGLSSPRDSQAGLQPQMDSVEGSSGLKTRGYPNGIRKGGEGGKALGPSRGGVYAV